MVRRLISRAMSDRALSPAGAASAHEDPRWTAVATRDAAADGSFVFAVKTTGVYCRPLRAGDGVSGALYAAGYGSPSRLYERSDPQLGMTPATYRRDGKGATIEFTTVRSPLGRLMVAATTRGLAAVSLGEDDARLERA